MERDKYRFTVELAGVPIEVVCRFRENYEFFREYWSDNTPVDRCEYSSDDFDNMVGFLSFAASEGATTLIPSEEDVENITINSLLCETLVDYGVLQFHGSALRMDGEAYIFTAPSGTGKSTHSRFWRETYGDRVTMINDDKPLIKIADGGAVVYGSPWDGKHRLSRNISAPLKAIVHLTRGAENRIERITATQAFPVVFRQAHASNSDRLRKIMEFERILLQTVPCYKLRCNMNPEAAVVALNGICENG